MRLWSTVVTQLQTPRYSRVRGGATATGMSWTIVAMGHLPGRPQPVVVAQVQRAPRRAATLSLAYRARPRTVGRFYASAASPGRLPGRAPRRRSAAVAAS